MFKSIGIDNLFIEKRLSKGEIRSLIDQSPQSGENKYNLIWEKAFFSASEGTVNMNINIPKMAFEHNVKLSDPALAAEAFYKLNRLTDIDFEDALITGVHVSHIQEIDYPFSTAVGFCQLPKRGYEAEPIGDNIYFNEGSGRKVLAVYDKALHIDYRYPNDVHLEFDRPPLFRAELKVEKQLKKQLNERGLWTLNSLEVSDLLYGHAYHSFVKMYESVIDQFLKVDAKVVTKHEPSKMEDIQRKYFYDSILDNDNWESFKQNSPYLNDSLLEEIEVERTLYQREVRKNTLIQNIKSSCKEIYEKYPIQVNVAKKHII